MFDQTIFFLIIFLFSPLAFQKYVSPKTEVNSDIRSFFAKGSDWMGEMQRPVS